MEKKTICEVMPLRILNLNAFVFNFLVVIVMVAGSIFAGKNLLYGLFVVPAVYEVWKFFFIESIKLKATDQRITLYEDLMNT